MEVMLCSFVVSELNLFGTYRFLNRALSDAMFNHYDEQL